MLVIVAIVALRQMQEIGADLLQDFFVVEFEDGVDAGVPGRLDALGARLSIFPAGGGQLVADHVADRDEDLD